MQNAEAQMEKKLEEGRLTRRGRGQFRGTMETEEGSSTVTRMMGVRMMFCRKREASHRRNLHVQAVKGTAGGMEKRRAASDGLPSDSRLREETALTGVRFSRFLFARVTGDQRGGAE